MITRAERKILRKAADIAARELEKGNEVRLPGFGKLYLTGVEAYPIHPMSDADDFIGDIVVIKRSVRFRPWRALKRRLNT